MNSNEHKALGVNGTMFAGTWSHLFGPGRFETQCRIVIDVKTQKLVAAQALSGLNWVSLSAAEKADLSESLFEANDVSSAPAEFDLEQIENLPDWAIPAVGKAAARVAKAFCEGLGSTLTASELELVCERNRSARDSGACHTHDFCDANAVMVSAFVTCGLVDSGAEVVTDDLQPVWNTAWRLAADAGFRAGAIQCPASGKKEVGGPVTLTNVRRSVVQFTVMHFGETNLSSLSLAQLVRECDVGECLSGTFGVVSSELLTRDQVDAESRKLGSDGAFFLDEDDAANR
ncbi:MULTISPECIES: hypothetical protein [Burkholderia]|uniref:Uncharacterized protein n=2 Tax=Burkholderia cepacia complex TaxID=87882 RepID=A0AAP1V6T3_9BURK|nr:MULTISPECIES: hypothetical protein [Burkholderia]MBK1901985.1 hypothetical protein [Burkholderia contaminans]MBK1910268.1 hypothetical protein [Burkholderia contaminans]MBK1923727.1 hypothetical protein [Burkholderia contaminans]MBK1931939.1 hypothetical protein [Burkholderia contaminans]MBK1939188.1 hypothetical protein [Burkholderia contaminans]